MLKPMGPGKFEIEGIAQRTFIVNGQIQQRAAVGLDTPLVFGVDFHTTVRQLLKLQPVVAPPPPPPLPPLPPFYGQLEKVWREYNDKKQRLALSVSRLNNARMVVLP